MRVVLVDAPGAAAARHWSRSFAGELAGELLARGAAVEWFRHGGHEAVPTAVGLVVHELSPTPPVPLHDVAKGMRDHEVERTLTTSLRSRPADALVHVGAGARGSPNLLWIADRMGCATFAVVRAAEVVCQRGDLVDFAGAPCSQFDDPVRCQRCCRTSRRRQPRVHDLLDRQDLLVAGLNTAAAVFAGDETECNLLAAAGVSRRIVGVSRDVSTIADRVSVSAIAT